MKELPYNYKHFDIDNSPKKMPLEVGQAVPDFTAQTLDGQSVRFSSFFGKPIVFEFCSITCPISTGGIESGNELLKAFPDVQFIMLYTREAHPGEKKPQPEKFSEKVSNAQYFKEHYNDQRVMLIDNLEGAAHKLYGIMPNAVYVLDKNGVILYRSLWARHDAVRNVLEGGTAPEYKLPKISETFLYFRRILRGGKQAGWDFVKQFPKILFKVLIRSP